MSSDSNPLFFAIRDDTGKTFAEASRKILDLLCGNFGRGIGRQAMGAKE
jgi:hypothetical protein